MNEPRIAVLCGGISSEREVSLASGHAVAEALRQNFNVDLFEINSDALPDGLNPETTVVFPALHGGFGEDGALQNLLEERGVAYAGCGVEASRICLNKKQTKERVEKAGLLVVPGLTAAVDDMPPAQSIIEKFGSDLVIKPVGQGSSVGVVILSGLEQLESVLRGLETGEWLIEKKIDGREITAGVLEGKTIGLVEVLPQNGFYDYKHKYTDGMTEYRFPAQVEPALENEIGCAAETSFSACGCRDFARIDFILSRENQVFFLEINTLPGLTATSLLPKSATCSGYDFTELVRRLIAPAIHRFKSGRANS